jgi:formate C-acetyltransferase
MFQFAPVSDRIRRIRAKKDVFTSGKYMTLNTERTKIYTDYCRAHDNEYPILKRAGALKTWCETKKTNVLTMISSSGHPVPTRSP